jgi:alpha-ribazole phosphatase
MKNSQPFWIVRHSAPTREIIDSHLCYGHLDIEISEAAFMQSLDTLDALLPTVATLISSPSQRCARLAVALCDRSGQRLLRFDERLREINFGRWEGVAWHQIDRSELDVWVAAPLDFCAHGGESVRALAARVIDALSANDAANQPVIWITHNGPIRVIQTISAGHDLLHVMTQPGVAFGAAFALATH